MKERHPGNYKLYSLCQERILDESSFPCQISRYPFEDHHPPPFSLLISFARDIGTFLNGDSDRVCVVHCKAGKGRTGTVICAYLLWAKIVNTTDEAIRMYGQLRTLDGQGITIPSQKRYIQYFEDYLKSEIYSPQKKKLKEVRMHVKGYNFNDMKLWVSDGNRKMRVLNNVEISFQNDYITFRPLIPYIIEADFAVQVTRTAWWKDKKLWRVWLNTAFILEQKITLSRIELDYAWKRTEFGEVHVDIIFD
ncbi:uncharacterized protein VTP21DRAFT_11236 [Calcarisporiella thermophila]|uniref:uncharacterized protein n=1 Tax=Calcarisporiella thermophila TaxID=911321 RepID=UPI00374214E7